MKNDSLYVMHSVELVALEPTCASDMCKPYTNGKETTYTVYLDHLVYLYKLL